MEVDIYDRGSGARKRTPPYVRQGMKDVYACVRFTWLEEAWFLRKAIARHLERGTLWPVAPTRVDRFRPWRMTPAAIASGPALRRMYMQSDAEFWANPVREWRRRFWRDTRWRVARALATAAVLLSAIGFIGALMLLLFIWTDAMSGPPYPIIELARSFIRP